MRYIRNVHVSLIIGLAAVALPITAEVGNGPNAILQQPHEYVAKATGKANDHQIMAKTIVKAGIVRPQDYYDRRREYWEQRMDRRLEESDEYMDDEDGGKNDKADSKDSKGEDDSADNDADREEEALERRREYWQRRLDRDW
jgi:hypothetical protein